MTSLEVAGQRGSGPRRLELRRRSLGNLACFLFNCAITWCSNEGLIGKTNDEVSAKYQTLLTPAGWIFSIWGAIFGSEAVAMFIQMLPQYRFTEEVGIITPWWRAACLFQGLWILAFAYEAIAWSAMFMFAILFCLVSLAIGLDEKGSGLDVYILLRMPFALHMSWILIASVVNVNALADALGASPPTLIAVAVVSLGALVGVSSGLLLAARRPEPLVPLVACLSFVAIADELLDGYRLRSDTRFNPHNWNSDVLEGFRRAALCMAGGSAVAWFLCVMALALRPHSTYP